MHRNDHFVVFGRNEQKLRVDMERRVHVIPTTTGGNSFLPSALFETIFVYKSWLW